jgi:hypothetical protein
MALPIGDQHRALVESINKVYPNFFEKKRGLVASNELHKKIDLSEVHNLAIICSRVLNMHGASVGDVNLYKLLESYILDENKRRAINEII